jgi:hypothetical protein
VTEDEKADAIAEQLAAAGVEGVQAVCTPADRMHPDRWAVALRDTAETSRTVYVLKHIDGVTDIRRAKRRASVVTFIVT